MKRKRTAKLEKLATETWYLLGFVDAASILLVGREAVVTSANDSHDQKASLHNEGLAADFRTHDVPMNKTRMLRHFLKEHLDPQGFDTVLESDHLHVEYDPKEGEELVEVVK